MPARHVPLRSLLAALACGALATGCVGTMAEGLRENPHDLARFGGLGVDAEASELTQLVEESSFSDDPTILTGDDAANHRSERKVVAAALTKLFGGQAGTGEQARFKLAYGVGYTARPIFVPCLFILVFFGCPATRYEVQLDLTIEARGKLYSGHGMGTNWVPMWVSGVDSYLSGQGVELATGRALGAALDDALAKAGGGR